MLVFTKNYYGYRLSLWVLENFFDSKFITLLIIGFLAFINPLFAQVESNSKLNSTIIYGPYLGQEPPGMTPEIFVLRIVSTVKIERFPWISPDNRYLFFVRGYGDIYWVSASIIEELKNNSN